MSLPRLPYKELSALLEDQSGAQIHGEQRDSLIEGYERLALARKSHKASTDLMQTLEDMTGALAQKKG